MYQGGVQSRVCQPAKTDERLGRAVRHLDKEPLRRVGERNIGGIIFGQVQPMARTQEARTLLQDLASRPSQIETLPAP
jgi:hypothetical protein